MCSSDLLSGVSGSEVAEFTVCTGATATVEPGGECGVALGRQVEVVGYGQLHTAPAVDVDRGGQPAGLARAAGGKADAGQRQDGLTQKRLRR